MTALNLWSEPYAASGNVSAEGATRTLKATRLDPLSLLVREAVQNSNDAGYNAKASEITFRVEYYIPTPAQREAMLAKVFPSEPPGLPGERPLRQILESPTTGLLLISDHGTTGLGGPTRADVTLEPGDRADFVNFLRNIGAPQDTPTGGGTYGFGKAALFNVSRVHTVIVHTLCRDRDEERLIAAGLGSEYDEAGRRYTGRHWWGVTENGVVEPLRGEEARVLAEAIGLPARAPDDYGTTVAIVAPEFDTWEEPDKARDELLTAILVWCWPKMLAPGTPGHPRVQFLMRWRGEDVGVPSPFDVPALSPFAEALAAIDAQESRTAPSRSVQRWSVEMYRPARKLGTLALKPVLAPLQFGSGLPAGAHDSAHVPFTRWKQGRVGMVARMRRARLVVDYLEIPNVDTSEMDFAAVFLPAPSTEVDTALAASEPPSHDDWNPDQVQDKNQQQIVRMVRKRIDELIQQYLAPTNAGASASSGQPSLGRLADSLAALLPGLSGPALGGWTPRPGGGRTSQRGGANSFRVEYKSPVLREADQGRILEVPFTVTSPPTAETQLKAKVTVQVDGPGGGIERDRPAGAQEPRVLSWLSLDDNREIEGDVLTVNGGRSSWICRVLVPDEDAVWHVEVHR